MKPLNKDENVIKELKRQIKAEKEYNKPFKEAREIVKKRKADRVSSYDKFKATQKKNRDADEMLNSYLLKKEQNGSNYSNH